MDLEMLGAASAAPATLTEALQDRLRQDIILGALRPGAKLKLEMLSYDVSVNTMREALSRMAAEGLVVVEAQKGFTVLPVSLEDLRQITEMRQLLECHALRQSIARADLDWEAKVVGAYHKLSKVEALVETDPEQYGDSWERYNQEFHAALIANCQSRWLILFHKAIYAHGQRYRMLSLKTKPFPRAQSAKEHRRILNAALARDADKAAQMLARHILKGAELTAVAVESEDCEATKFASVVSTSRIS
jgi:GntR family carbon starvation induced transcriptional regulator